MPSNAITEINPQSLGPMQQIRPPQSAISIPNPLNVTPFFQASQLLQNKRRLDQEDISLQLRAKQQEFNNSHLLFEQTKEILNYHDKLFEQAFNTQVGKGAGVGSLGLDTKYKRGAAMQAQIDAKQAEFYNSTGSLWDNSSTGKDPNAMNQLLQHMRGVSKVKQDIMSNPEWRELSGQTAQYQQFMTALGKVAEQGNIDDNKRREVQDAYERLQNGDQYGGSSGFSKLKDQGVLNNALGSLSTMVFDHKDALTKMDKYAQEVYAPFITEDDVTLTGGTRVTQKYSQSRSRQEAALLMTAFAKADPNIIKTFEASRGIKTNDIRNGVISQNDYDKMLLEWADGLSVGHGALNDGKKIILSAAVDILDRGSDILNAQTNAAKASGALGSSRFGDGTETERELGDLDSQLRSEGLNPLDATKDQIRQLQDVRKSNGAMAIHKEVNPTTGKTELWEVQMIPDPNNDKLKIRNVETKYFDKETGEEKTDEDGIKKGIYNRVDDPVKIRKIAEFNQLNTTKPSTNDDRGSLNNNPGNIRATPEQIRKGTVPVDDRGFIKYNTIEEGEAASLADNNAKIDGNSSAMKGSPYMVAKYKDKVNNYKDFATVEDLLNVRTPSTAFGGDNSPEELNAFLNRLENRGFPKGLLLKDLDTTERVALNKAIIEVESPDSYVRLYSPKPAVSSPANPNDPTVNPSAQQAGILNTGQANVSAPKVQPLREKLLKGETLTTEDKIPFVKESGSVRFAGKTVMATEDLKNRQQLIDDLSVKIDKENIKREIDGKPIIIKNEDTKEFGYGEILKSLNKVKADREEYINKHVTDEDVIADNFKEEAKQSYEIATNRIVETLESNTINQVDLEPISFGRLDGTIKIAENPGYYKVELAGKKAILLKGKEELNDWIENNLKDFAFQQEDPIQLAKDKAANVPETVTPQSKAITQPTIPSWVPKPKK